MKIGRFEKLFMDSRSHKKRIIGRAEELMNLIELKELQTFLEVGCGSGAVSIHFAKTYPLTVTGVDVDPAQIKLAQYRAADMDIQFLEADATKLPFEDESFDIVLSFGVTHHIHNWMDALNEIARVIKTGKYFIYWDIMYSGLLARIGKSFKHSYGITTVKDFNRFREENGLSEIHVSLSKSWAFDQYEAVFQKT
jgi:ubiquinone/menaquinone biosynthesis C-methylase UbiE